jgi:long-chain fatty acid transport protein
MLDDEDRTPTMPVGATWRWGLGLQHALSEATTLGGQYGLAYCGDLEIDQERGPLSGRIAGEYEDFMIHLFSVSLIHRF